MCIFPDVTNCMELFLAELFHAWLIRDIVSYSDALTDTFSTNLLYTYRSLELSLGCAGEYRIGDI